MQGFLNPAVLKENDTIHMFYRAVSKDGYSIMALNEFYDVFKIEDYKHKMYKAFSWFLGNNHLNQIVYNPCTGGCYDGLENRYINLNQGAESTISYLMARLTVERYLIYNEKSINNRPIKLLTNQD